MHISFVPPLPRAACLLVPLCAALYSPAGVAGEPAGEVKTVSGRVTISRNGDTLPASPGHPVYVADRLHAGPNSSVGVTLRDETLLSAGSDSSFDIKQFSFNKDAGSGGIIISVLRGTLALVSGLIAKLAPDSVKVVTPQSTIGIRGTEFVVEVKGDTE